MNLNDNLSAHFTLGELTHSDTALRLGIKNLPSDEIIENLKKLCALGLERVRSVCGDSPLIVSSGYRCLKLNRAIKSKDTSQHILGCAADFTVLGQNVKDTFAKIKDGDFDYDQLIIEYNRWIHFSISPTGDNRKEAFGIF